MKTSTMLSQITTQEDVLFGSITIKQLLLWMSGGLVLSIVYMLFPDTGVLGLLKVIFMLVVGGVFGILSCRYKQTLLVDLVLLRLVYHFREKLLTD